MRLLVSSLLLCAVIAQNTVKDEIISRPELSRFRDALNALGLLESLLDDSNKRFTIFAPNNEAISASQEFMLILNGLDRPGGATWLSSLTPAINNHIVEGQALTRQQITASQANQIQTRNELVTVTFFGGTLVGGASFGIPDITASNGVLHIMSGVVAPSFFKSPFSDLELQPEFLERTFPDNPRVSLSMVVDHLGARSVLNQYLPGGQTFVGCRLRAFNVMGLDYLTQTINRSPNVKFGELMNVSFVDESIENLLDYSLIPQNIDVDKIPNNYQSLVFPSTNCSHMWITKNEDRLCFNDGCVVDVQNVPRKYLASNGIGYVVDRCQLCQGIAMLVIVASQYTNHRLKDTAQFFTASEWNLRNLSMSVGDGGPVTLFAADDAGWNTAFNVEDAIRLTTDEWKRHQWDFLAHMMVQGEWTEADLKRKYQEEGGAYNMTSLIGEPLEIDMRQDDRGNDIVTVAGGDLYFKDVKGVDGWVHFISEVPRPFSITHDVYDIANELREQYTIQVLLIDTVFLRADIKRLLPLTAFFAPNEEWKNKIIEVDQIGEGVLKNMLFENLWWCDRLRENVGERIESLNGQTWTISLNDADMPCFETAGNLGDVTRACITKCDILARNGIVHELDTVLLSEVGQTLGPTPPIPPAFNNANAPIWTVREAPTYSNPTHLYTNPIRSPGSSSGAESSTYSVVALTLTLLAVAFL